MRKTCATMALVVAGMLALPSLQAADRAGGWTVSMDVGGNIPLDATLTDFEGPTGDNKMKLNAGFQMDVGVGYAIAPWLEVGPELGFTFNNVDRIGDWSYPDTTLSQLLMMMNVRLEYPPRSRLAPFVGAGVGGAASFLTFGDYYDYYYYYPDGTGADFVFAYQAFAGLRFRVSKQFNLGLVYRYQATANQEWDVDWWDGSSFDVGVDSIRIHSVCLLFSGSF